MDIELEREAVLRQLSGHRRALAGLLLAVAVLVAAWSLAPLFSGPSPQEAGDDAFYRYTENLLFREEVSVYPVTGRAVSPAGQNLSIGFATQTNELDFGRIPWNGSATKMIQLDAPTTARIQFATYGDAADDLRVPDAFLLNGSRTVEVTYDPSEQGNMSGTMVVRSVAARNPLGRAILQVMY